MLRRCGSRRTANEWNQSAWGRICVGAVDVVTIVSDWNIGARVLEGLSEPDLVRKCRAGEPAAWRELVRRYTGLVYRLSIRMLHNAQEAEEVSQEVFVRVHGAFATFDPTRRLAPWVARTTYHACLRRLESSRARSSERASPPEVFEATEDEATCTPEQYVRHLEARSILLRAMDELSAQDRALLDLRYRESLSDAEVAEATGIPVNTVKTRIFRARAKLRAWLAPLLGEEA